MNGLELQLDKIVENVQDNTRDLKGSVKFIVEDGNAIGGYLQPRPNSILEFDADLKPKVLELGKSSNTILRQDIDKEIGDRKKGDLDLEAAYKAADTVVSDAYKAADKKLIGDNTAIDDLDTQGKTLAKLKSAVDELGGITAEDMVTIPFWTVLPRNLSLIHI